MISGMNLYAYCNNNPVSFIDPSGKFIISALLLAGVIITSSIILKSDSVYDSGIKKMEEDAVMLATENYHSDVLDAVEAWGEENSKASIIDKRERGAFIYSKEISGKKYYYIGKTRTGYETTCWNAFIFGYLFREGKIEGFIHTHTPYPNKNGTWNYKDYGPSDADMFLFKIPGVKQQYIANSLGEIYMFDEDGDKYFLDYSN